MAEREQEGPEPLVSVLMITYNHNPYIIKAIEGVLSQETSFPIELVIGEDCSTDGTRDIVLDYQKRHPEIIRAVVSDANVGVISNFRRVHEAARGKYIAYCEGDDYWHDPAKLQMQVDYLEGHPECALVHSDCDFFYVSEGIHRPNVFGSQKKYPDEEFAVRLLAHDYWITTPTVCTRRLDVLRVRAENPYEFDGEFLMADKQTWLEVSRLGTVHYIARSMATMNRLPESATESRDLRRKIRFSYSSLKLREHYIKKLGISGPDKVKILLKICLPMLEWSYKTSDRKTASGIALKLRNNGYRLTPVESLYVAGARNRAMRLLVAPFLFLCRQAMRLGRLYGSARQTSVAEPT